MTTELLISIDLEADGPIPGTEDYSMLSLGACLVDYPEETFYIEIKPISDKFNPDALAVSGLDRETLKITGAEPEIAMLQFEDWVNSMMIKYSCDTAVAVTLSEWDNMFVDWYSVHFLGRRIVHFTGIDMKSYFMGKHNIKLFRDTGRKQMLKHYSVTAQHTHNALDDSVEQAEIARQMLADKRRTISQAEDNILYNRALGKQY